MKCPSCKSRMGKHTYHELECYTCIYGCGLWLHQGSKWNFILHDKMKKSSGQFEQSIHKVLHMDCPECHAPLQNIQGGGEYHHINPDVCIHCQGLFISHIEFKWLKKKQQADHRKGETERYFRSRYMICNDTYYEKYEEDREIDIKEYLFSLFTGMPVEINLPPQKTPYVTILFLIANVVFFLALSYTQALQYSVIPQDIKTSHFFTSMFMHAGWLHLLSNMYFLYVFGDNVEDRLGPLKYILLYFICGVVACLTHIFLYSNSSVPFLGASGAVGGLMGGYFHACRKAKIGAVIFFVLIKMHAYDYFIFWMIIQILLSMFNTGIAWDAHLGGFLAGLLLYPVLKNWSMGKNNKFFTLGRPSGKLE
ncbi:rhomboid family intramembrane serine protease [Candidatus Uabimicrobium amorphum]|uniref:Rhomboid family intramembrane serine protease n=1 Tax=Uabimicrobium amorphum TaxID=2596890 RepID=A0A5S9IKD9_UABAM|nr:rhomboid family intramembrane serine protease [Candidatus Uabimicrobium amorphum]BBM83324.1 rhomboid family intramembrane serine protease [Candidatus Uabimicrobium amorphum]